MSSRVNRAKYFLRDVQRTNCHHYNQEQDTNYLEEEQNMEQLAEALASLIRFNKSSSNE